MTRAEREEMKALSLELFGVSSKWKTIVERGYSKPITCQTVETVPGDNDEPDTQRTVEVPVLTASGAQISTTYRPTEDEVRKMLLDLKSQRDVMIEERRKIQEELDARKKQQETLSLLQKVGGGSAL